MNVPRKIKRLAYPLAFLLLLALALFAKKILLLSNVNDGFDIDNVHSKLVYNPEWEVKPGPKSEKEMLLATEQGFTYLNKGAQCYSFISDDGRYILKFFKHQHLSVPTYLDNVPLPFVLKRFYLEHKERRQQRLNNTFQGCKLAFDNLREETGLIYLHLNKTSKLKRRVKIIDTMKNAYFVDLDNVEFMLQRRVTMFRPAFKELARPQQHAKVHNLIAQVVDIIAKRLRMNIVNSDHAFDQNYGVANGRVFEIDVGQFVQLDTKLSKEAFRTELEAATKKFKRYLTKKYPIYLEYLNKQIDKATARK